MIKLYQADKEFNFEKNRKFIAIYDSNSTKLDKVDYQGICFKSELVESFNGSAHLERFKW